LQNKITFRFSAASLFQVNSDYSMVFFHATISTLHGYSRFSDGQITSWHCQSLDITLMLMNFKSTLSHAWVSNFVCQLFGKKVVSLGWLGIMRHEITTSNYNLKSNIDSVRLTFNMLTKIFTPLLPGIYSGL
jgi:hypothetical protein